MTDKMISKKSHARYDCSLITYLSESFCWWETESGSGGTKVELSVADAYWPWLGMSRTGYVTENCRDMESALPMVWSTYYGGQLFSTFETDGSECHWCLWLMKGNSFPGLFPISGSQAHPTLIHQSPQSHSSFPQIFLRNQLFQKPFRELGHIQNPKNSRPTSFTNGPVP